MEAENVFNNTVYQLNNNNSDTGIPVNDKITKLATAGRAVLGMSIVLTNIALLIFYKHRSKKADILEKGRAFANPNPNWSQNQI